MAAFTPKRTDIDAFLSLVPDIPETEVIQRLKVPFVQKLNCVRS
jgi:hypothetical protein